MSTSILATSETLQGVLLDAMQTDPDLRALFSPLGPALVSLATPDAMVDQDQTGISVWLYRVFRDENLLNAAPRRLPPDRLRRVALPMRALYLITPMMRGNGGLPSPEADQHVLGAILRTFHSQPILTGAALAGALSGTDSEVSVRLDDPGLEELARVWDTLEEPYRASISYEVGVIEIDDARPSWVGPPVTSREPVMGSANPITAGEAGL
ncbi:DUF4255 domain-containing protein [Erythrobacter ani]|uniref:DUF4255 domain-containing protein n=1 Tax=Erythrobacter ani TaxID=2827235 RepID=A0ABS6SP35_9SPHN|nr:DUF4255 domain-containing protein [Erythrobacter ani]